MELFFADPEQISGNQVILDEFESRHIMQTLRKKVGEIIHLTNGCGEHFITQIIKDGKRLHLQIEKSEKIAPAAVNIILAVGFIKPNRLEFILEKCTELGVNKFILFRSQFTNYISYNKERFVKIFRQAIKQSLQYYLPEILILDSMDEFLQKTNDTNIRFCAVDANSPPVLDILNSSSILQEDSVLMTIGPEGGFAPEELDQFKINGFQSISLGKNRLRTETAAITSISIIQSFIQQQKEADLGN